MNAEETAVRIALYWHNGLGLGHISTSAKVARALLQTIPNSTIAGIAGSSKGLQLLPRHMDLLKLPSYLAYDRESGFKIEPVLPITEKELFHIREELITVFIKGFRPHILHVEFDPQGTHGELTPTIISTPSTKMVLGLRGVLASREETNDWFFSPTMARFIDEHFCAIYAHTDPQIFRLEDYYNIPRSLAGRIEYVGYLAEPVKISKAEARGVLGLDADACIIVASFGGGQGSYRIWQRVLEALALHRDRFDLAYLAAGPYLEDDDYEKLRMQTAGSPNVTCRRFLEKLPIWMKASDLFIGAGGVNSLGEIIATRANALIVPRQLNDAEQEIHSSILAELGVIRVVSLAQLLTGALLELVDHCLSQPLEPRLQIVTGGARRVAEGIKDLLGNVT